MHHCNPSLTFIKSELLLRLKKEWRKQWENLTDCRQSRAFITFEPSNKERGALTSKGTSRCRKMLALLTGHNNLRYHTLKCRINSEPNYSPCCRFCRTELETSWHLMYICPSKGLKRRDLEYSPQNPKKGSDIEEYERWALTLGILDIILTSTWDKLQPE